MSCFPEYELVRTSVKSNDVLSNLLSKRGLQTDVLLVCTKYVKRASLL